MALTVVEVLDNTLPGVVCGKACHPSGLHCGSEPWSAEVCLDLHNSPYIERGYPLTPDVTGGMCSIVKMDQLLGPNDPYNETLVPPYGYSLALSGTDPTEMVLKVYDNLGVEFEADDVVGATPGIVWVRFYGYR